MTLREAINKSDAGVAKLKEQTIKERMRAAFNPEGVELTAEGQVMLDNYYQLLRERSPIFKAIEKQNVPVETDSVAQLEKHMNAVNARLDGCGIDVLEGGKPLVTWTNQEVYALRRKMPQCLKTLTKLDCSFDGQEL